MYQHIIEHNIQQMGLVPLDFNKSESAISMAFCKILLEGKTLIWMIIAINP